MTALPLFLAALSFASGETVARALGPGQPTASIGSTDPLAPSSAYAEGKAAARSRPLATTRLDMAGETAANAPLAQLVERPICVRRVSGSSPERSFLYRLSVAVLISGAAADAASSWGRPELNPVLRDSRGQFGRRGLVVKVSVTGGIAALAHLVSRRHPRAASVVNIAVGASWHAAAAHNRRLQ